MTTPSAVAARRSRTLIAAAVVLFGFALLRITDLIIVRSAWPRTVRFIEGGGMGATSVATAEEHLVANATVSIVGAATAIVLGLLLAAGVGRVPVIARVVGRVVLAGVAAALGLWWLQRIQLGSKIDGKLIRNFTVLPDWYNWTVAGLSLACVTAAVVLLELPASKRRP